MYSSKGCRLRWGVHTPSYTPAFQHMARMNHPITTATQVDSLASVMHQLALLADTDEAKRGGNEGREETGEEVDRTAIGERVKNPKSLVSRIKKRRLSQHIWYRCAICGTTFKCKHGYRKHRSQHCELWAWSNKAHTAYHLEEQ